MKSTNSYKLSIEKPCEEQWDDMRKNDCGRFCQLCQKSVVDFTMMSDREIIQFIENHREERICGRVAHSDLNRVLINYEVISNTSWKFKLMSILMFVGAFFTRKSFAQKSKDKQAQNNVPVTSQDIKTSRIDTTKSIKPNDKMLKMPQKYAPTTLGEISFSGIPEKKKMYILDSLTTKNKAN